MICRLVAGQLGAKLCLAWSIPFKNLFQALVSCTVWSCVLPGPLKACHFDIDGGVVEFSYVLLSGFNAKWSPLERGHFPLIAVGKGGGLFSYTNLQ